VEKILAEINRLTLAEPQELRNLWVSSAPARPSFGRVNDIKGPYSFGTTSSESFAARKRYEIELEDRRSKAS